MSGPPLLVPARPCSTCPYVRATPPGIWHADEYLKLPAYDEGAALPAVAEFHCHVENATHVPTVCRGWLGTHRDGIAVRLATMRGRLRMEDVPTEPDPRLYPTGEEACRAGLAAIPAPPAAARKAIDRLVRKGEARS